MELRIWTKGVREIMYQVRKRDGKIVEFDLKKIGTAIMRAFEAQGKQFHPSIIDMLALKVTADFEPKIKEALISRIVAMSFCEPRS